MGKAKNLKNRVSSYFQKNLDLGTKTSLLVAQIAQIRTIITGSEIEAFLLESQYIKKYKPKYNIKLMDDKAYPMIKISIKDDCQKVLVVRRADDIKSVYFGPFPNGALALRTVLKTIRRIFPYVSVPNHAKRVCLYYHLGLCPCPPVFNSPENRNEYKKDIKHIIDFLNGNTRKIIRDLKTERDIFTKLEEFEKASLLQNKINAIELITGPFYKNSLELNVDPNLTEDIKEKELNDLISILSSNNVPVKNLERIECYDISNISGTNAVGSMVVFINGEKDGNWYRKFKIKTLNTPNDFAMMDEVLCRRLKHKEWPYPDLIIVDGGKGQVSTALKVLRENKLKISLIGLAKKEETIVIPQARHSGLSRIDSGVVPIIGTPQNDEGWIFVEISLPKNSDALNLIMRIRDEAHHFAITYHRHLRSKSLLSQ